jgi:dTDP-4-dehydrorhamnose 3,5-epimerase
MGTFHLTGSGPHASWADVAELALELAGSKAVVKRVSTKEYYASKSVPVAERPLYSVLDNDKAAAIGVELPDWRDALERYIAKELD